MSGYIAEFTAPDGTTATVGSDRIAAPDIPDEHSVKNEYRFEIRPGDTDLEAFRHGRVELYFEADDGERRLIQSGPIDAIHTDDSGVTRVRGKDDLQRLSQTGPEGTIIADGEAADEIERVWGLTPFEADVTQPEPRPVADGRVIQDGDLTEIFTRPTDPFVVSSGELRPAQAGFTRECDGGTNPIERDDFSDGVGQALTADGQSTPTLSFSLDYTVPADAVEIHFRGERIRTGSSLEAVLDGQVLNDVGTSESLDWTEVANLGLTNDLKPGSHTLELVVNQFGDNPRIDTDLFTIVDGRFNWTFDNAVTPAPSEQATGEDGYLDGPEEIPPAAQAVADIVEVTNSITAADLTVASDTAGTQSLAIEFGPTGEFSADLSGDNTQTLSGENPSDLVSDIRAAVTLGHTDATRDTQTPRTGFESQSLTSWELAVDEVSIIVFNGREFSGTYYQILQEMHREGGLIFRNVPTEGDELQAETFEKGALTDSVEWTRLGFDRGYESLTDYANVLTAVGGEADDGTRPVVEVSDEDEIARVGEEKPAYRLFESRTDERALLNRAQAELRGLTDDQLSGSVEIVPRRLKPGYAYEVPAFETGTFGVDFGEYFGIGPSEAVLVRQQFADGKQPSGSLEFEQRRDISNAISGVRRETRSGER